MDALYSLKFRSIYDCVRREGLAFNLICLYLFFEYVRPQSIYTEIDVFPFGPVIIVAAGIVAIINNQLSNSLPNLNNKLIVLYGVIVILSSSFSEYPMISLSQLRTFFDWFLIYFLIIKIVNNERRLFVFILLFLLFSFKMSQHGFLSWASRGFSFANWGVVGGPGWFHNSGEVGIQMCIFVPLGIAFILGVYKYTSAKMLFFLLLMPFTGIGTVVASSSRGALFGLSSAGIWSILKRPKRFILGGIMLSLAAAAVYHVIPRESIHRFESMGSDRDSVHRLELWRAGLETLQHFPFLGVGFEAWTPYYPRAYGRREDQKTILVHNIFIQCGSELGYTGLFAFLLMIFACFRNTRRVRLLSKEKDDKFLAKLSYGLDSALIGLLVSGAFVTVLYYPYFWIHCALTTCINTAAHKKFAS